MLKKQGNLFKEKWNSILMNNRITKKVPYMMLGVSLAGFGFFYLIPFLLAFGYSIIDNPFGKHFCGFDNYIELFQNTYFIRGIKNTGIFMLIGIPANMVLSLFLALFIRRWKKYSEILGLVFLIPLALPSATSAFFWQNFFGRQGTLNKFLALFQIEGIDWLNQSYSMVVIIVIFLWKNIGYNMALYLSGLSNIPEGYYEYAEVEGAGRFWKLKNVTLVYLAPTMFFVLIMSFVNSFKMFREIYLITGDYPSDSLYVLQHFMNNNFLALDYPKLSSAVYLLTLCIIVLIICLFRVERVVSENLHD